MSYTLGTAATAAGINKSTVLRSIKSGRISATRTEQGNWSIEPAEFHRVFPAMSLQPQNNGGVPLRAIQDETPILIATLQATIADLRADRDAWKETAQRLALADKREPQSLWRWLRSTG